MYFDALTAAAVGDELRATVLGGFVQKIILPNAESAALEVYAHHRRQYLLLTAEPVHSRVVLLSTRPTPQPGLITPFGLLLRKYALDGVIKEIQQPATERIISLSITKRHDRDNTRVWLQAELMGRHGNLLLLDGDRRTVLESSKRVTPDMSRVRPILPKKPYTPPPPREGLPPHRVTPRDLEQAIATSKPSSTLWQAIVSNVSGFSPLVAREAVYRAGGNETAKVAQWRNWVELANETRELASLWATRDWKPCVATSEDGGTVYAPYELTHLADSAELSFPESMSEAIERYSDGSARLVSHQQLREQILSDLDKQADRVKQRLHSLQQEQQSAEEGQQLMEDGQMVLAYAYSLEPGATELKLEDRIIRLDPQLTPAENAQKMFDRYKRRKRAEQDVPSLIAEAQQRLDTIEEYRTFARLNEGYIELARLRAEAINAGLIKEGGSKGAAKEPTSKISSFTAPDGTRVLVGKTAGQNVKVLDSSTPDDWWFHAREISGGHVIARTGGREPSDETLRLAAETAAYYSAYRESPSVEIVYCQLRNVRRIKGSRPGHVTYRNERGVNVRPQNHLGEG